MEYYILTVLWVAIENLFCFMLLSAFFPVKRSRAVMSLAYLFYCVLQTILVSISPAELHPFIAITALLLISLYLFDGKWIPKLIICVLGLLVLVIMDNVTVYGAMAVLGLSYEEFVFRRLLYSTVITAEKLFVLFLGWYLCRFRAIREFHIQSRWMLLALLFPLFSLVFLITLFLQSQNKADLSIGIVILSAGLALANIGVQFTIYYMEKATRKEQEDLLLRRQMDLQAENILALEKSYRAQRQNVHEFRHHLQTLQTLLEENQISKAQDYLNTLRETQAVRVFSVRSGHSILDVVLNEKYQAAQEKNISMQIQVNDLSALSLPTDALVVLLSNLLDNAIEAAEKCAGSKEIECKLLLEDSLYLSVGNTTQEVNIVNGQIATTKADKLDHGYGLMAVRKILDGWKAEYTFGYKDGWFQFAAEIPIPQ